MEIEISASSQGELFLPRNRDKLETAIRVNGVDCAPGQYRQGLNLVVIDSYTGEVSTMRTFACADEAQATDFAVFVEGLLEGELVAMVARGGYVLHERARRACAMLGSSLVERIRNGDGWVLIGAKGVAPGSAREQRVRTDQANVTHRLSVMPSVARSFKVAVTSRGKGDSARARSASGSFSITIDGVVVASGSGEAARGLNVVVVDEQARSARTTRRFDTFASVTASRALASFIRELPAGTLVAIAVCDEGAAWITGDVPNQSIPHGRTPEAIAALRSLGSGEGARLRWRNAWAFVGRKGCLAALAEVRSKKEAKCEHRVVSERSSVLSVRLVGGERGDRMVAALNGREIASLAAVGGDTVGLIVLDENDQHLVAEKQLEVHDEHAIAELTELVRAVRPNSLAIVTAGAGAWRRLTAHEQGRAALEGLGSPTRAGDEKGRLALVGRMTPGHHGLSITSPASPLRLTYEFAPQSRPEGEILITAASGSGATAIKIGGFPFVTEQSAATGLNVVLFEKETGRFLGSEQFAATEADAFVELIDDLPVGVGVAVVSKGAAALFGSGALAAIGAGLCYNRAVGDAYAVVGVKGGAPGTALEDLEPRGVAAVGWALPYVGRRRQAGLTVVRAVSQGLISDSDNGYASIRVGVDEVLFDRRGSRRGMNVCVFADDGAVLDAKTFDTHGEAGAPASLVSFLDAVEPGHYVAIAIHDEAVGVGRQRLPPTVSNALKLLGSACAEKIGFRDSWSFVAQKGGPPLAEALAPQGKGEAKTAVWISRSDGDDVRCTLVVEGADGEGSKRRIWLDDLFHECAQGIDAVAIQHETVLPPRSFDPDLFGVTGFMDFVDALEADAIVAVAISKPLDLDGDLRRQLTATLASLGFLDMGRLFINMAWLGLIGFKGAPPGAAVQALSKHGESACGLVVRAAIEKHHMTPAQTGGLVAVGSSKPGAGSGPTILSTEDVAQRMAMRVGKIALQRLAKTAAARLGLSFLGPLGWVVNGALAIYDVYQIYKEIDAIVDQPSQPRVQPPKKPQEPKGHLKGRPLIIAPSKPIMSQQDKAVLDLIVRRYPAISQPNVTGSRRRRRPTRMVRVLLLAHIQSPWHVIVGDFVQLRDAIAYLLRLRYPSLDVNIVVEVVWLTVYDATPAGELRLDPTAAALNAVMVWSLQYGHYHAVYYYYWGHGQDVQPPNGPRTAASGTNIFSYSANGAVEANTFFQAHRAEMEDPVWFFDDPTHPIAFAGNWVHQYNLRPDCFIPIGRDDWARSWSGAQLGINQTAVFCCCYGGGFINSVPDRAAQRGYRLAAVSWDQTYMASLGSPSHKDLNLIIAQRIGTFGALLSYGSLWAALISEAERLRIQYGTTDGEGHSFRPVLEPHGPISQETPFLEFTKALINL
jgi:hypothetical protein